MGEVLTILSGKGGTGKTSVCAGIAAALAEEGRRVLCIDCDVGLRNLDISLGLSDSSALSFLEVMNGHYTLADATVHTVYPSVSFLTAPMNCPVEQIDPLAFQQMLRQARKHFDYILLDAPAGVDAGFRLVTQAADRFLLVTGAGAAAMRDAGRVGELLELMGKYNLRLIVNRVDRSLLGTLRLTIDDVMDTTGIPLLGVIPEDPAVTLAASFGMSAAVYSRRSPAVQAFRRIARRIQGFHQPITLK